MGRHFRRASPGDIESLLRIDPVAEKDNCRRECIARAVRAQQCWVVCETDDPGVPLGYGCLDRSFFGEWFIPLVVVSSANRRSGVGRHIVSALEQHAFTEKIFTSTNTSNSPMRQLLTSLGYQHSGMVENLDPGDPELIFVKFLSQARIDRDGL
ncbi:GNAT family N-acetyltransferase [Pseudomonas moraviensis]|uniref:GNAT superfamily N-acetyltransferase n=1 Tax=Pseudomonas moraviensis TaxID=321662 RepID=A0A7Y9VR33_9PSED|nr:GNAT family N-acetyltransferase [Pseudomonas moraviensis]NYH06999.1 GNAT superfamily N-acetyltransferase [Pseudomonas moraviensis]